MAKEESQQKNQQNNKNQEQSSRRKAQPIVAIGASAGGLDALKKFFANVPKDTGIGFVVLTHTKPDRKTMLPELLSNVASIPVVASDNNMPVTPNQAIVAKDSLLAIDEGVLRYVKEDGSEQATHHPIDHFFRALAADQQEYAICVVLSGSGNDGTLGVKAIKAAGGMVMIQDPYTASYSAMPENAQATGVVDYVESPEKLPGTLVDYCNGPYLAIAHRKETVSLPDDTIHAILVRLRSHTGQDFTHYKRSTMARRIQRRMNVHLIQNPADYLRHLKNNPQELDILLQELLISVTSFFRDPQAFKALAETGIHKLLKERNEGHILRVWVPGCATGEEAYSVAILLHEQIRKNNRLNEAQIFATDLDKDAIQVARHGLYPAGISADVSKERLQRYFSKEDDSYRIHKNIRNMIVFAVQNVISDPPFIHTDLIVCRNLLIYLNNDAQQRLLPIFHYALRPNGLLFLGSSERIIGSGNLFEPIDTKHKILQRKENGQELPHGITRVDTLGEEKAETAARLQRDHRRQNLARSVERMLLSEFAPCSVVVDDQNTILYIHGKSGTFFQPEQGQPRNNVVEMAREGLRFALAQVLRRVRNEKEAQVQKNIRVRTNGEFVNAELKVESLKVPEALRGLLLITIREIDTDEQPEFNPQPAPVSDVGEKEKEELKRELQNTRENLQSTIEELETSNEELKSSNEEMQSTNEELQSSNEELETSKEEMQSMNEELSTVNAELKSKIEALARSNDDMKNLLNSMQVAIIFLDNNLRVKRYTKKAQDIIRLIDSDVGRPLSDLTSNLKYDHLNKDCQDVLSTLILKEIEVQDTNGRFYQIRILPYRTSDNVIDGVVLTIFDITRTKQAELEAQHAREFFESIVQTVRQPLMVLHGDLRVVQANDAFYDIFELKPENTENQLVYELNNKEWDIPQLRNLLENILPDKSVMNDFRVEHNFPKSGKHVFLLNARQLKMDYDGTNMILLAFEEVTGVEK